MKPGQRTVGLQWGCARLELNHRRNPCLATIRNLMACAIVAHGQAPAQAEDTPATKDASRPAAAAPQPPYAPQGYQMERYKAFARQAELPVITATNQTTLEFGGGLEIDITRLAQLPIAQEQATANRFGVPTGVIDNLVQRLAKAPQPTTDQFARELRTAVVDYRFLQREWERYQPPAPGQATKTNALAALQRGELGKAWELYDGLRKPQAPAISSPAPPTNLRVVTGP